MERDLGGDHPARPAVRVVVGLQLVDHGDAGLHDPDLVLAGVEGMVHGEEVRVGPADHVVLAAHPQVVEHGPVDPGEAALGVLEVHRVREVLEQVVAQGALPRQDLLGVDLGGDVLGDAADADDVAAGVPQGDLVGEHPGGPAGAVVVGLQLVEQVFAGLDDPAVVLHGVLGPLRGVHVGAGLADEARARVVPAALVHVAVDPQEAAFPILEVDVVRDVVRQDDEGPQLLLQGAVRRLQGGDAAPQRLRFLRLRRSRVSRFRSSASMVASVQALGWALA